MRRRERSRVISGRPARRYVLALAGVALIGAAVLAGCGSSEHTVAPQPPVTGTLADVRAMVASTVLPGTVLPPNADTTASLLATMNVNGLRGASAVFVLNLSLANVGNVSVLTGPGAGGVDVALDRLSTPYGGVPEYAYTTLVSHPLGVALPFDGAAYHVFAIAGASAWGAFEDSVRSVAVPTLDAPGPGASIARNADLAITWTDAGADTTVYVACAIISTADSSRVAPGDLARDASGTATITAGRLGSLPAGPATLAVTRFRLAYHTVTGRRVGLASMATSTRNLTLN